MKNKYKAASGTRRIASKELVEISFDRSLFVDTTTLQAFLLRSFMSIERQCKKVDLSTDTKGIGYQTTTRKQRTAKSRLWMYETCEFYSVLAISPWIYLVTRCMISFFG